MRLEPGMVSETAKGNRLGWVYGADTEVCADTNAHFGTHGTGMCIKKISVWCEESEMDERERYAGR